MKIHRVGLCLLLMGLALSGDVQATNERPTSILQSDLKLNGTPLKLGVIRATTTKNNHDTATPFVDTNDALEGKVLMMQCSAACNVNFTGTTNAVIATTDVTDANYGVELQAKERVIWTMALTYKWIAVVGTADCVVWEMK